MNRISLTAKRGSLWQPKRLASSPASSSVKGRGLPRPIKSQAMRAIIGAAWEDSDQSLGTVMAIIQKLKNGYGNLLKPGLKIPNLSEDDTVASPESTIASSAESMQQAWTPRSNFDGSHERPSSSSNSALLHVAFELPVISDDLFTTQMLALRTKTSPSTQ
ncbi:hypothetical protein TGAMA5MH_10908 [Trichoderma gamsii]|uniref:Uncharacterized protein n=1 Tax=Trichoderma gamsii TaxID=398673 RepID=A0A2K0SV88_9HYPO|nr:hypothetical protein TGAMA5MH_10908 [Trichoderma gamsii]